MPIPACEISNITFQPQGKRAPHVLPCGHVFSMQGILQVVPPALRILQSCSVVQFHMIFLLFVGQIAFPQSKMPGKAQILK
jgi:hypothetical protein